jgi:hypothetical protein
VSAGELLRRTGRTDGADRGHRPDADLRGVASAPGACPVCLPLQHRTAASGASAAPAAPDIAASRAGPWQDPASTDPGRPPQRVRDGSLKPLVRRHVRVLEPHSLSRRLSPLTTCPACDNAASLHGISIRSASGLGSNTLLLTPGPIRRMAARSSSSPDLSTTAAVNAGSSVWFVVTAAKHSRSNRRAKNPLE